MRSLQIHICKEELTKRQRGKSSGNCAAKGQSINISMSTDTNFIDLTDLKKNKNKWQTNIQVQDLA